MDYLLAADQAALRDSAGDLLAASCPPQLLRDGWDGGTSPWRALWRQLAEMGVFGMLVAERDHGLGLDMTSMVPVLEEVGRAAAPGPVTMTAMVAAPLLSAAGAADLLPAVLSGDCVIAGELEGTGLVPHADGADQILLRTGEDLVLHAAQDISQVAVAAIDRSRRMARVTSAAAGRVIATGPAMAERAWLAGCLGTAAELVGLSRHMIDMTVSYVAQRTQFGVPVGSFQAVKHQLADACGDLEVAAPCVAKAAWSLSADWPLSAGDHSARADVLAAKVVASRAAEHAAAAALQCHGALGYTVEYDLHLFAKRAWALSRAYGGRLRVAVELGLVVMPDRPADRRAEAMG